MAKRAMELNSLSRLQPAIGEMLASQAKIGELIAADFQALRDVAAGIDRLQTLQPLLEAERERCRRMAAIGLPHHQLLDSLKIPTPGIQAFAEARSAGIQQAAERHSQALIEAASAMSRSAVIRAQAMSSLQIPVRVHAYPVSPATRSVLGRATQENQENRPQNNTDLIPSPERTHEAVTKPDLLIGDEARTQELLNLLNSFVESKEISGDVREGLTSAIAWFKLNQRRYRQIDGRKLNLLIHAFLRDQHGLETPPEFDQLISSGLLIPSRNGPVEMPELEPEIYTSKQVAEHTTYTDANIRRIAKKAWKRASGPARIQKGSVWWVVAPPESRYGGRRCGWQFQKQLTASPHQS